MSEESKSEETKEPEALSPEWLRARDWFMVRFSAHSERRFEIMSAAMGYRAMKIGGNQFMKDCEEIWQNSGDLWEKGLQEFYRLQTQKTEPEAGGNGTA